MVGVFRQLHRLRVEIVRVKPILAHGKTRRPGLGETQRVADIHALLIRGRGVEIQSHIRQPGRGERKDLRTVDIRGAQQNVCGRRRSDHGIGLCLVACRPDRQVVRNGAGREIAVQISRVAGHDEARREAVGQR